MNITEGSIDQEILTAEREVQANEDALEQSRQRLQAVIVEKKRRASVNQRAMALLSGKSDEHFGKEARKTSVQDLLNFLKAEISCTVFNANATQASLADVLAMMAASLESET